MLHHWLQPERLMDNNPHKAGRNSYRRVLIVEDEPRLRTMLIRAVAEMEFVPQGAASAEDGLRAIKEAGCDIAIVDLRLPKMDGIAFCHELRQHCPHVQTIILTGYGDLDSAQQAIRLDAVDFLTKPCRLSQLESALDRALRRCIDRSLELLAETDADATPPKKLEDLQRRHILEALKRNDGSRKATAAELGISIRTLYYRLAQYDKQP